MIRAERHVEAEMDVCGGITVFLSLILTCICALMGGLFESAPGSRKRLVYADGAQFLPGFADELLSPGDLG